MSDPIAKAKRSKAKDARQIPAPDAVPRSKSKKDKPWRVEGFGGWLFRKDKWWRVGDYRTREIAENVIENLQRKERHWSSNPEYRVIAPDGSGHSPAKNFEAQ